MNHTILDQEEVRRVRAKFEKHCEETRCLECTYNGSVDCGIAFALAYARRYQGNPASDTEANSTVEPPPAPCNCLAALAERVTEARAEMAAYFEETTAEGHSDFDAMSVNIFALNRAHGAMVAFDKVLEMIRTVDNEKDGPADANEPAPQEEREHE